MSTLGCFLGHQGTPHEKKVGKAVERGLKQIFDKFIVVGFVLAAFPLLFFAQIASAQGNWTETGTMSLARGAYHTLTRLCDGRLLVVGATVATSEAEIYDPASGVWTPTGSLTIPRNVHSATLLPFPDCRVLVAGGGSTSGLTASAELYDPVAGTWSLTGDFHRLDISILLSCSTTERFWSQGAYAQAAGMQLERTRRNCTTPLQEHGRPQAL